MKSEAYEMTLTTTLREADLKRPLPKDYVQCRACAHYCAIAPGQAGKCGVRQEVEHLLKRARTEPDPRVRGLLAPHAGYFYSGKVAAEGFKALSSWRGKARRVRCLSLSGGRPKPNKMKS